MNAILMMGLKENDLLTYSFSMPPNNLNLHKTYLQLMSRFEFINERINGVVDIAAAHWPARTALANAASEFSVTRTCLMQLCNVWP